MTVYIVVTRYQGSIIGIDSVWLDQYQAEDRAEFISTQPISYGLGLTATIEVHTFGDA